MDCDIKCFDYPWSSDSWAFAAEEYVLKVATYYGTPIGFAVYLFNEEKGVAQFPKIGVKPTFRRRGVGRMLLRDGIKFATTMGAPLIETVLPESILRPNEPNFVGEWMTKMGWKATGIERDFYPMMGQKEDGIRFILKL